ncbi:MAG: hypothetical protein HY774_06305, partial [Acidobacteria bacterium]|nr:hypothetical protein [Acidobacteriota bacterium]
MINQSSLHRRVRTTMVWAVCLFLVAADSIGVISALAATHRRIQAGNSQIIPISVSAKGRGTPWVDFQDATPTSLDYVGQEAFVKAVASGQARPLSIAIGDLDNDGTQDVISGYASGTSGLLMVQKGTAALSNGAARLQDRGSIFQLPQAPYLLQVGDFDGDGKADAVAATTGQSEIQWLRGDGFGGFAMAESIAVPGNIISLTSAKKDTGGPADLAIGLAGDKSTSLLIYAGQNGGLKATPHSHRLPLDEPTQLALSEPTQQGLQYLGVATGQTLMLVKGLASAREKIKRTFESPVQGIAFGNFTQLEQPEVAVLVGTGDVFVFSLDELFSGAETEGVLFGSIPNPKGLAGLTTGRFAKNATGLDDLLVMDRGTRKIYLLIASDLMAREDRTFTAEFDVSTRLVAVAPIQLTAGQPQDLVVLSLGPNVSLVSQTKKEDVVVTSPEDPSESTVFAPTEKRPELEVNPLYSPGKDGALTVTTAATIVNRYTFLTANAAAGATSITVDNTNATNRLVPTTHLTAGDLILIIQMQGATMTTTDSSAYGTITAYNNAGKFEFFSVSSVGSTTISLANCTGGLRNSYTSAGRVQVIKVPQYTNLTVNSPGYITAPAWNGSFGGIVAAHVQNTATLNNSGTNGSIQVSGLGFRGGALENNTAGQTTSSAVLIFRNTDSNQGAEKGEGIAGNQTDYNAIGRYGRGAPANGGGGGNSHNAGGGGGSNGDNGVTYDGLGNPSLSTASWATAWNLESAGFSTHTSSGGGRGGYSFSSANRNATVEGPGDADWGGDGRDNTGGWGGKPLDNDPSTTNSRIFMGGGGGAGDANNGPVGGAGGNGGGIVFLLAATVSGTGTILANGNTGGNTTGTGNDAPGGGGGGGSVVVKATTLSGITINANGGVGGTQTISGDEAEGPGGGGGGGFIATSGGTVTQNVNGGLHGTSNSSAVTEFIPNGATRGATGETATAPADASFPFCFPTGTVTGHVFTDTNGDGIQNGGEPDLVGVSVTITPATGSPITVTTDASGNYTASGVAAGSATVDVADPANTNETTNVDPQTVTVTGNSTTTATTVGFQPVGTVTGHVFTDTNGNGVQDSGEPDLSGVSVTVDSANGPPITVTTDANGNYTATNVAAGLTSVNVADPANTIETTNVDPQNVTVTQGATATAATVGFQGFGSVSGHVFTDTNGNGIQDSGEPDLNGVSVTITPANGSPVTVTTNASGNYSASNIPVGNVTINVADPANTIETTNVDPQTVTVTAGANTAAANVGFQQVGTVTGHVFTDTNGNGIQDSGEPDLSGVNVTVDSVNGAPVTVTTDANGNYTANNIPTGSTSVDVADPANTTETTNVDPQTVTVNVGATTTAATVGFQPIGSVSGHVFTDTNGNGIQDSGEPDLNGVSVTITPANGSPVTVTTNASGNYSASNIPAGSVTINVADPANTVETTNVDPQTVTVTVGANTAAANVGFQQVGTVTGHVFTDTNGNGTQDSGEPNLGGVSVTVDSVNGPPVTVTTDANGNYTASNIPTGSTTVDVADPANTTETTNVDPQTVTVSVGATTTAATVGFQPVGTVSGHVFTDTNGNGIQDSGEPNLSGVDVVIDSDNGPPVTVTTDANGNYTANNIAAGSVSIDVADPANTIETTNVDPQTVTVTQGATTTAATVGYQPVGTVTGHVFNDVNGNGTQDSGEPNLSGLNVVVDSVNGPPVTVTTDANGNYTANNIPAGSTSVDVADPANSTETTNVDPQTVSVVGGNTTTAANVGYQFFGSVTGHVFTDTNGNGTQDSGEPNLSGVNVTVDSVNGAPVTVTTDANGNYTANNIPVGSTSVDVADPANTNETTNVDPQTVNVTTGATTTAANVGYQPVGTVTGHVFNDVNGNGVQDSGEPNLANVDVVIDSENGAPVTVQTDANGDFSAPNIAAGSTTVNVTDPSGFTLTTANDPQTVTVTQGGTADATDVGFQGQGTVTGHVFNDLNGDGDQDSGEPDLNGVNVTLTPAGGGAPITVTTDANGNYTATNVPAGNVDVNVTDPANTNETTNTDPQTVSVAAGGTATTAPVGFQFVGSVSGHVFEDVNGNGTQDSGEPDLSGVNVTLTPANGTPVTVATDANGNYTAPNIPAGSVSVDVDDPAGTVETTNTDPQTVSVTAGNTTATNPVGYQGQGTVTGHVFTDTNGNGTQDSGEPNLAGVDVVIDSVNGAPVTVTTDANGNYTANNIPAGSTTVDVADPAGTIETTNVDPQTVSVTAGNTTTAANVGYQPVGTVSGHVFTDTNGNGVQDSGEPDLVGVDVVIDSENGAPVTVQTDANGNYTASNIPAGSTTVDVADPASTVETTNVDPQTVTVTGGATTTAANVGYQPVGTVSGHVFNDVNGNGTQDSGEPNLANVDVVIDSENGAPVTVQTDANGNYTATNIPAGSTTVDVADPANSNETTNVDPQTVSVTGGNTTTAANVGYQFVGSVTGHVFTDTNGNGTQDSGEPDLAGVNVTLTPANGAPVTVTTDANGNYTASNIPAGNVGVDVADPANNNETTNVDPQTVTVTAGNTTTASAVGYQPVGTVSGHVFNGATTTASAVGYQFVGTVNGHVFTDTNGNGVQDSGEPDLAGVNVTLTPANGALVTVTTNAGGNYSAANIPAGNVGVDVADPAGTVETTNVDPQTVSVTAGNTTTASTVGYQPVGTVSGHVFTDTNGNGTQDSGEPNLAGVDVVIDSVNGAPVTVQTDENGNYTANNIPAGSTTVDVADPANTLETTNVDPQTVSVTGGATTTAANVGYQPVGTVTGHVFNDVNGNGTQD